MEKPKYLIKSFAPSKNNIFIKDFLEKGKLYTNTSVYYQFLAMKEKYRIYKTRDKIDLKADDSKGISDLREGLFLGCSHVFDNLPLYCMYSIWENDIIDDNIYLNHAAIEEFKSNKHKKFAIINYDAFCKRVKTNINTEYYMRKIEYGTTTYKQQADLYNKGLAWQLLYVKSTRYKHQQEYRIIFFDEQPKAQLIEEYTKCYLITEQGEYNGKPYYIGSLKDIAQIIDYNDLKYDEKKMKYILPVSQIIKN